MNNFEARKAYFEAGMAWQLQRHLHAIVPHLEYHRRGRYPWVHYRSVSTGWWQNLRTPPARHNIRHSQGTGNFGYTLEIARQLNSELEQRGAHLVLAIVPYTGTQTGHLDLLGEELDVPVIIPDFTGLQTADGSHLTPQSAEQASLDIWRQLEALPLFSRVFPAMQR